MSITISLSCLLLRFQSSDYNRNLNDKRRTFPCCKTRANRTILDNYDAIQVDGLNWRRYFSPWFDFATINGYSFV